jgi:hypothetical protein
MTGYNHRIMPIRATGEAGDGAIDIALSPGDADKAFILKEVRVALSGAGSASDLTVGIDHVAGEEYDLTLLTQAMSGLTGHYAAINNGNGFYYPAGSKVTIGYLNGSTARDWAVELVVELV